MTGTTNFHSGNEPSYDDPLYIWHQLQSCAQYHEYSRQIQALLAAPDRLWSIIHILRTDAEAPDLLEALQISAIYLIPPSEVWDLLVGLRGHLNWQSVCSTVLSQLRETRHRSCRSASSRSSAFSNRSYAGLSYGSARVPSSISSGYSIICPVEEAEEEDRLSHASQQEVPRVSSVGTTMSGKPSKMAPKGFRFYCPHPQCRGKFPGWQRRGDWLNHIIKYHQGSPNGDPYEYLEKDKDTSPHTPVNGDKREFPTSFAFRSSGTTHPPISTTNDFPSTGPEIHLSMHDLNDDNSTFSMMPNPEYYRKTGVYPIHVDTNISYPTSAVENRQNVSHFNFDDNDDMEDRD